MLINFGYTTITSPITGKIGRSLVTPGALLSGYQANNMAVVQTLDPIYVDVNESSRDLLKLKKEIAEGRIKVNEGAIPVSLTLEDGSVYPLEGKLELSEVSVDEGTGTITLRAVFPNPNQTLLPGMYVRTKLPQGLRENAIFVPQRAVLRESNGSPYVYVVQDGKIAIKKIKTEGTDWLLESGLEPGDKVVIEGLQRIRPGVPVNIVPTMAEQAAQQQKK